jgi:PPK2 family polyphosphate:nucleotide phosphotransferase
VSLKEFDGDPPGSAKQTSTDAECERNLRRLTELQQRLNAEEQHGLLVVLLGVDTSGKDETIQDVFGVLDLRSARSAKFGAPTEDEERHDFLWRFHPAVPARGEVVVFNRSYYDDIVEPWIAGDLDDETRTQHYAHVRHFEQLLTESGITILKVFFYISKAEQAKRIRERLEDPMRQHEFSPDDIEVQEQWDTYQTAFEDLITATSTEHAPWYIVPANKAWFRTGLVASLATELLAALDPQFPAPLDDDEVAQQLQRLDASAE